MHCFACITTSWRIEPLKRNRFNVTSETYAFSRNDRVVPEAECEKGSLDISTSTNVLVCEDFSLKIEIRTDTTESFFIWSTFSVVKGASFSRNRTNFGADATNP